MKTSIAILATGHEVVAGEIVNSNCQQIADELTDLGFCVKTHMAVRDDEADIVNALRVLSTHAVTLVIGGLGPTSDDRTRHALASFCQQSLEFDQASWQHIENYFSKLGKIAPDINRHQCWFPLGSRVLTNANGTANGCDYQQGQQRWFLLPGPPRECLPMFRHQVLPLLTDAGFSQAQYKAHFLLLGIGESDLAEKIQQFFVNDNCVELGYRASFPYLRLKLHAISEVALADKLQVIKPLIQPYLVSETDQSASVQLQCYISESKLVLALFDQVTFGRWATALISEQTASCITFNQQESTPCHATLIGSNIFQSPSDSIISFELRCAINQQQCCYQYHSVWRGPRSLSALVEWASWTFLQFLQEHSQ